MQPIAVEGLGAPYGPQISWDSIFLGNFKRILLTMPDTALDLVKPPKDTKFFST